MEKKLIIIDEGIKENLSFEEVFSRYERLIKKHIKKWIWRFESEDLYQVGSMALWESYSKYNPETKIGFGYYANFIIEKRLLKHNRDYERHTVQAISLEKIVHRSNDRGDIKLIDTLGYEAKFDSIVQILDMNERIKELTEKEKNCIRYKLQDLKQAEIGKKIGVSQVQVCRILRKAVNKLIA
ncbi:sigma-70 family RNA polymerase sigma factor [Clostridium ganghwense]|uniref:Sigma-70 family RNA polymerase sigma factor n=1 Tax=Clostridium ganghwense TaxID=312089 RepID=A0ABT4CTP1_9CLOT|nr:sigma-70 family RNA polymerase sigma factor [Clostridium ganghwense]MCY6372432.1 sigma-70 family RNA polymerase sigma factor [Clostridium ganghwense]